MHKKSLSLQITVRYKIWTKKAELTVKRSLEILKTQITGSKYYPLIDKDHNRAKTSNDHVLNLFVSRTFQRSLQS